jgi:hypothetical protein
VCALIPQRDRPQGWFAKFMCAKCAISAISAKSAISAISPLLTCLACRCLANRGRLCSELSTGELRWGRTLPCLCLEQVSYMDKPVPPCWAGGRLRLLRGQAADKRDDICLRDRGCRVSRLSASVSSGLGWPQAGVRWCGVSKLSKLLNKRTH